MTDKKNDRILMIIAVAVIAVVLAGEVIVYTSDYTDYSADAKMGTDGRIEYSVSASGSKNYSAIAMDNGSHDVVDKVYIYHDESYKSAYEDVYVAIGARELDQAYYVEQLAPTLRYRNISDITVLNASELADALRKDAESGNIRSGLICLSGAFPDTIYTGNRGSDVLFDWLDKGGSLYWIGNMIGKYSATTEKLIEIEDYQKLFFGSECLYSGDDGVAYDEVPGNRFTSAFSLMSNNVRYGVNGSLLPTGTKHLEIGFERDGYSSASLISYGSGMICVIGGDYSNNQRYDLAQIICSGIGPKSEIKDIQTGSVTRGSTGGTLNAEGSNLYAFIYLGGYYPVYCRAIEL